MIHAFSFLDCSSLGRGARVCKQWRRLTLESPAWQTLCRKEWGDCGEAVLAMYSSNWREMLARRPRLTRNGFASDRGRREENKDSHRVLNRYGIFGIFHGHGDYGAGAAEFVAQRLPALLQADSNLMIPGDVEKAVINAFRGVEAEFAVRPRNETDTSGTSALVVVFRDGELIIANVGGSEAVLGRARPNSGNGGDGALETVQLSHSHLTYVRPDERDRVRQAGGRVENDYVHPMYSAGYGLVLTRSIGDEVLKPWGVVAEPEVWHHTWKAEDRFIIMATRELWKYVFATDAVEIVRRSRHPKEAADALVREARELGAPGNITALVLEPYTLMQQAASREARELPTARGDMTVKVCMSTTRKAAPV